MNNLSEGADIISLFCRIHMNAKRNLPIRSSEMGLLLFVQHSDEAPTSLDAAHFFKVSKPMIAGMVRTLVKDEYIMKQEHPEDQRRFTLHLTNKAQKLVAQTKDEYLKNMSILYNGLGKDDYDTLIHLLNRSNQLLLDNQ